MGSLKKRVPEKTQKKKYNNLKVVFVCGL